MQTLLTHSNAENLARPYGRTCISAPARLRRHSNHKTKKGEKHLAFPPFFVRLFALFDIHGFRRFLNRIFNQRRNRFLTPRFLRLGLRLRKFLAADAYTQTLHRRFDRQEQIRTVFNRARSVSHAGNPPFFVNQHAADGSALDKGVDHNLRSAVLIITVTADLAPVSR